MRGLAGFAVLSAVLGASLALAGETAARVQQAPSSRVTLDLPEGYQPSQQFSGFVNEGLGVSLVILELPGAAYEQVAQGMTAEALAAKGLREARNARLERAEPYVYIRAEQDSAGATFAKFLVAFRQGDVASLVTANVLKTGLDRGAVAATDIERILASAAVAPVPAAAREVFALDDLGPFKAAGSILGTTRIYTLDGRMEPPAKDEPRASLIVAPSLDRRPVLDPEAYSETLLTGLPGLGRPLIEERRRLDLAGFDATEIVATAKSTDGGSPVALYQVLVLGRAGGYVRLVGQAPLAERERLLPEFRRIARGLRLLE